MSVAEVVRARQAIPRGKKQVTMSNSFSVGGVNQNRTSHQWQRMFNNETPYQKDETLNSDIPQTGMNISLHQYFRNAAAKDQFLKK